MADLIVQVAAASLPGRALRDSRLRAVLYLGACLPDILEAGASHLLQAARAVTDLSHAPLVLLPVAYLAALLFEEAWRRRAFWTLLLGAWGHVLVDWTGGRVGGVLWGFPFTMSRSELGDWGPREAGPLALGSLGLLLLVELGARLFRRPPGGPQIPRRRTAS